MNKYLTKVSSVFSYLWGKKAELSDMDERDALLAKVVMDIHRKRSYSSFVFVPLEDLFPIHPINRENAIAATKERVLALDPVQDKLREIGLLDRQKLNEYLPSVSAIKVVKMGARFYVAFEGNGRLGALQEVFSSADNLELEVELYHFDNSTKIVRRINRLRKMHKLDSDTCVK